MGFYFVGFGAPIAPNSYRDGVFFPLIGSGCGEEKMPFT